VILASEKEKHTHNVYTPVITEMFQDVQVTLFQTPKGYAVPISLSCRGSGVTAKSKVQLGFTEIRLSSPSNRLFPCGSDRKKGVIKKSRILYYCKIVEVLSQLCKLLAFSLFTFFT
jgi:hypothetical protein